MTLGEHRWITHARQITPLEVTLVMAAFIVLIPRRRWPMAVYVASGLATLLYLEQGYAPGPIFLAPFWGLLTVIATARLWQVWLPAAAVGGAALATVHGFEGGNSLGASIFLAVWITCAVVAGMAMVVRRRFAAEVAERRTWAQRSRAEEEGRRLAEERLRIAREVHDVLGHSLAVISLQAGVAEHLLDSRPQEVRQAVSAIRRVSRQALGELRAELASLRSGSFSAGASPTPGMADVQALVQVMREAGLHIDLEAEEDWSKVPAVVGSAAYRIVQESLTNVARHAGASATVTVIVRRNADSLEIEVSDDGGKAGLAAGTLEGHGIAGMRERVAALGGRFQIEKQGAGVRVRAELPVAPS
ncbi:MAG: sensor histidine kinase [Candidatus Dormiibacterota bacterium]